LRNHVIVALVILLFVLLVAGCAEKPTPVGAKLLPGADLLQLDTLVLTATQSYNARAFAATSGSPRVLIGKLNNLQCYGIYRFGSLPDSIKNLPIVSAEMDIRTLYHFGDSLAPFSMTAHQILMNWGTDSLTIDSLNAPGFYQTNPCGTFSTGSLGDTIGVSIPLDTNVIRAWGTFSDTTLNNFGVLLRPTNANVVKGFGSFNVSNSDYIPKLLLRFRDAAGAIDTCTVILGTTRFVTTGLNTAWPSDSTHLWVMNGGASRGYVRFDVSGIPAHAAIHKATLALTLDAKNSLTNYFTADSAIAYFTNNDSTTSLSISALGVATQVGSSTQFEFPVGSFVQRWVRSSLVPVIAVAGFDEQMAIDLFSFYGVKNQAALKPKLTVIYSILQ
jgi:hypothetical protein